MTILQEKDRKALMDYFQKNLVNPVKILLFTQGKSDTETDTPITVKCQTCAETESMMKEVAELDERITLEIHDFFDDEDLAKNYGVERLPAILIINGKYKNVRLFGIPSGYEFSTITKDIAMISKGQTELSDESKEKIAQITEPVHIQVFVTPTCPYCPRAVLMGHQIAMENDNVTADMVEASEFVEMATKYSVMGVPRTVINDKYYFEGALPETLYVNAVLESIGIEISDKEKQQISQYLKQQDFS